MSRKEAAEVAIRSMGITFTVYGGEDSGSIYREWPFDIIPRLLLKREWDRITEGLTQRVKALNLFIDDVYHEQRALNDGVLPREYIDKSREFYAAQQYERPYRWARNDESPFTPLVKPLSESRIGLVTTAMNLDLPDDFDTEELPIESTYAAPIDPTPERLFTQNRSWDKEATHTSDLDSFFPVHRLQEAVEAGRVGSISPRFYGVPTEYSQRRTNDADAPKLLELMREDGVDVAMLVPL